MSQPEGVVLRYPGDLGMTPPLTTDMASSMLHRAVGLAASQPFIWSYIDKPPDGQTYLLFIPNGGQFPNDGIRFQESENRVVLNVMNPRGGEDELELFEVKYGFIPGSQDTSAARIRRRFRILRGGNANLVLVQYSRGQPAVINPQLLSAPVRQFPMRPIHEPAVYVSGEKVGQKVFPGGGHPTAMGHPGPGPHFNPHSMPGHMGNSQAMVAQQNMQMEQMERRHRAGSMTAPQQRGPPIPRGGPVADDDYSGDESEFISTRTVAETRYKRNHEMMNDVFRFAATGQKKITRPPPFSSQFKVEDLDAAAAKLEAEIETLRARAAERKAAKTLSPISD